ncbi:MAG: SLC13 family permease [Pseudomonadota bacterium]
MARTVLACAAHDFLYTFSGGRSLRPGNIMTLDQGLLIAVLLAAMVLFVWGRWRYDLVAIATLTACALLGLVAMDDAFTGFGHPAVILVAVVLAITRAFVHSGLIDRLASLLSRIGEGQMTQMVALTSLAAVLSMFMNNVGALALIMPVAVQAARAGGYSPGRLLMPVAFGSILGGMVTLIGTPPNIIVAGFRPEIEGEAYGMFSYAPVGLVVVAAGLAFIFLIGWRLLPRDRKPTSGVDLFEIGDYVTEMRVLPESPAIGLTLAQFEAELESAPHALGIVRDGRVGVSRAQLDSIRVDDILLLQVDPHDLPEIAKETGLELVGDPAELADQLKGDDQTLVEAVIAPGSRMIGSTSGRLMLRRRFGVNLIAVAREGTPIRRRLREVELRAGDVLLLQTDSDTVSDNLRLMGCLPLAERDLRLSNKLSFLPVVFFGAGIVAAASGIVSAPLALLTALVAIVVTGQLPLRDVYDAIDWPVVILLGAMIPVGEALTETGAADLIADEIALLVGSMPVWFAIGVVMVVTMTLSDVMNNAATAVVMAPISIGIAEELAVDPDGFLMAVAVGASCAFLTPIGHQNNTLIMGPGGYRFGDFWRMGLPLEIIVVLVAVPMIMLVWLPGSM